MTTEPRCGNNKSRSHSGDLAGRRRPDTANTPTSRARNHAECARTKIRDGLVANRPVYAAIGVTLEGERDILGLWAGTGGEGAKFWMSVLTDLRNGGGPRRVLRRLRRTQRPARCGRERVAADDRADLIYPLDPQHLPSRLRRGPDPLTTTSFGADDDRRQSRGQRDQRRFTCRTCCRCCGCRPSGSNSQTW